MPGETATKLPIALQGADGCYFRIIGIDQYHSQSMHQTILQIELRDFRGAGNQQLMPASFLLSVADLIYRLAGREPRDQALRVEVALAPPAAAAAAPAPVLQLVPRDDAGDDVEAIKKRMLEGR